MKLSDYFSRQAKKPSGIFGRFIMSKVFDKGNANINSLVLQLVTASKTDQILEIGFGPGNLIYELANRIEKGHIEGIDFSETMMSIARKRNKQHITSGKVILTLGDFDTSAFGNKAFDKICTVNTLYFWSQPNQTLKKIADLLKPEGVIYIAFEDSAHLKDKPLDRNVFSLYSKNDAEILLKNTGLFNNITTESRIHDSETIHCLMANKI